MSGKRTLPYKIAQDKTEVSIKVETSSKRYTPLEPPSFPSISNGFKLDSGSSLCREIGY